MDQGNRNGRHGRIATEKLGLQLLPRQQQPARALPSSQQARLDTVRKPIENVLSVLAGCFGIERLRVKTDLGVYRRAQAKASAFALARYFNRALGMPAMNIARYAV